ncbi:hypothetical protein V6N13_065537 [Hibiscus sabdariffa]|uniref:Uncharacterized protein n=1 Tax=Hibiscus sabdariffa TaxID=183260 RepID=A0ABR2QQJ5_9ROSI
MDTGDIHGMEDEEFRVAQDPQGGQGGTVASVSFKDKLLGNQQQAEDSPAITDLDVEVRKEDAHFGGDEVMTVKHAAREVLAKGSEAMEMLHRIDDKAITGV